MRVCEGGHVHGERKVLLIEGAERRMERLGGRLRGIGFEPVLAESFDEAIRLLQGRREILTVALLPTDLPVEDLEQTVEQLRQSGLGSGVTCAIVGPRPGRRELAKMRKAGVELEFWDPVDQATLRFLLNRTFAEGEKQGERRDPRVPTYLVARLNMSGRQKKAIVYSLSASGAFLETPRAAISGAKIGVEIDLPRATVATRCEVVFSNVPGNLQRPNLPLGIGVRFLDVKSAESKLLRAYVSERRSELGL